MTVSAARKWIILASLIITGVQIVFLLAAEALHYPLKFRESMSLVEIISPVFLGYLGSATHFIFRAVSPRVLVRKEFLGLLVKGPIVIYVIAVITAFAVFAYTNAQGTPMDISDLRTALSTALGILAVTTGVITSYLFAAPNEGTVE
jgi:hypothetical protein